MNFDKLQVRSPVQSPNFSKNSLNILKFLEGSPNVPNILFNKTFELLNGSLDKPSQGQFDE